MASESRARVALSTTAETTLLAANAAFRYVVLGLFVSNPNATPVTLDVRETTGGAIVASVTVPANDSREMNFASYGLEQAAKNTNITGQLSAAQAVSVAIIAGPAKRMLIVRWEAR